MAAGKIQCDYGGLGESSKRFKSESDQTKQTSDTLKNLFEQLQGGDWIGEGANKFFAEMEDMVFPMLGRLINGLSDASGAAKQVSDALEQAEQEGQSLFV